MHLAKELSILTKQKQKHLQQTCLQMFLNLAHNHFKCESKCSSMMDCSWIAVCQMRGSRLEIHLYDTGVTETENCQQLVGVENDQEEVLQKQGIILYPDSRGGFMARHLSKLKTVYKKQSILLCVSLKINSKKKPTKPKQSTAKMKGRKSEVEKRQVTFDWNPVYCRAKKGAQGHRGHSTGYCVFHPLWPSP